MNTSEVSLEISPTATIGESVLIRGRGRISLGRFVVVEDHVLIDLGLSGRGSLSASDRVKLKYGSVYRCYNGKIRVGARTSVGDYTVIYGHGGVAIGRDVGVGPHCTIAASTHITEDPDVPIRYQGESALGIRIGDGVWIGAGVEVIDGVEVGEGTVVGAGSVVTKSLPPHHVCAGVPCRPMRTLEVTRLILGERKEEQEWRK